MKKCLLVLIALSASHLMFESSSAFAAGFEPARPGVIQHLQLRAKSLLAGALLAASAVQGVADESATAPDHFFRLSIAPATLSPFAPADLDLPPLRWAKPGDPMPQVWSQKKKRWINSGSKMSKSEVDKANINLMATAGPNQKITFFEKIKRLSHSRMDGAPRPGDLIYKVDLSRQQVTLYRYRMDPNDPNIGLWAQLKLQELTPEAREQFNDFLNADDFEPRALSAPDKIATSTVSTGKPGHRTQTGSWRITQLERNHTSTLYNSSMPYFQRFGGEDFGMHIGNLPGYPASHGCVRLPPDMAAQFFGASSKALSSGAWVWGVVVP